MGLATVHPTIRAVLRRPRLPASFKHYRWHMLIPALYTGLTVLLLWPLVAHLTSAVADTLGDPLLNAWTLRWVQHALVTNPAHLYDGNMFAPNARSLAFSELLLPQAIMAWPVWLIAHDTLLAYNLSVLVTYPLCAAAMYALCRALGANRGAAFVGGVCFAFAPFRLDNNAHLQVLSMQWMPLALLAILRYTQRPSRWRFVAVAATVLLAGLSSVYYLLMFGTCLAAFLVIEAVRQRGIVFARRAIPSRTAVGLIAALAVAAIVVVAIDVPYLTIRREQHIDRTLDEAYDDSAHPASYATVTPGSIVWGKLLPLSGSEHAALFPGAILVALSPIGLRAIRRPWMIGLAGLGTLGLLLSFGPTWGDKEHGIPLPYRLLHRYVTGYQGIRGPDRFAALVLLALCPLAAIGATLLWRGALWRNPSLRRYSALVAVALGCLVVGESATRLLPTVPVDRSAATLAPYRWLDTQADTGVVAEFPVDTEQYATAFYSTYHWRNVLWGHSGFIPAATYQLRGRFVGRDDFPGPGDLDALADMGVGTILIHRPAYPADVLARLTRNLIGTPATVAFIATIGDSDIYRLLPNRGVPPLTASVAFATNPLGSIDTLTGSITLTNAGTAARMLYTRGAFDLTADIRDTNGKLVSSQPVDLSLPAVIPKGSTVARLAIALPHKPGRYMIDLASKTVPILDNQPLIPVDVIDVTALPRLTLAGTLVTSPPLFTAGEAVAMWVTTREGKTIPLRDTVALPDGALRLTLPALPTGATQIVARGKASGVELWVAPP